MTESPKLKKLRDELAGWSGLWASLRRGGIFPGDDLFNADRTRLAQQHVCDLETAIAEEQLRVKPWG